MFIDKDSIMINNTSMGQYILNATYGYSKLYGEDTGRNLAGEFSGTLIGIFPKIEITFRKLTTDEIKTLSKIFDSATQQVTYYDPFKEASTTMTTYSGDWSVLFNGIGQSENIKISFISTKKRV